METQGFVRFERGTDICRRDTNAMVIRIYPGFPRVGPELQGTTTLDAYSRRKAEKDSWGN